MKRSYSKPTLTVYGRVEEITQTGCGLLNKQYNQADDTQYGFFGRLAEGIGFGDCSYS